MAPGARHQPADRGTCGARRGRHPVCDRRLETAGTLAAVCPRPYSEDPSIDAKVWELLHAAHVFERAGEFDLLHNQADFVPLAFSRLVATPMVTTIHGFSSERIVPVFARYNDRVSYVSISDADRHPSLNYAATIHHGIPLDDFPFDPAGGESLLFFGRIHSDKGAAEAIEAARCADRRLVMAGIIQDQDYFNRRIAPAIDGKRVAYLGPVGGSSRARTLWRGPRSVASDQLRRAVRPLRRRGDGLRHPGHRLRTGRSMPELIEHRVTGFLVDTLDEAVEAIGRIGEIDRASCRAAVKARFTVDRMADRYVSLYRSLLKKT